MEPPHLVDRSEANYLPERDAGMPSGPHSEKPDTPTTPDPGTHPEHELSAPVERHLHSPRPCCPQSDPAQRSAAERCSCPPQGSGSGPGNLPDPSSLLRGGRQLPYLCLDQPRSPAADPAGVRHGVALLDQVYRLLQTPAGPSRSHRSDS